MGNFMSFLGLIAGLLLMWYSWRSRQRLSQRFVSRRAMVGSFNRPNLKESICTNIGTNLSLHGDGVAVVGNKKDALLVKWVIENEYVSRNALEDAVHDSICKIGRSIFEWHIQMPHSNYPDHALSPEALGYAMKHGIISSKEIAQIRFDHGQTADTYLQYSEGLLEKVMRQLADGTAFYDLSCLKDEGDLFSTHDYACR